MDFQIDETTARTIRLALGGLFGTIILSAIKPFKPWLIQGLAAWSFSYTFGESLMFLLEIDPKHAISVGACLSMFGLAAAKLIMKGVEDFDSKMIIVMIIQSFGFRRIPADSAAVVDVLSPDHAKLERDTRQDPPLHP